MVTLLDTNKDKELQHSLYLIKKKSKQRLARKGTSLINQIKQIDNNINIQLDRLVEVVLQKDITIIKEEYKKTVELMIKKVLLEIKLIEEREKNVQKIENERDRLTAEFKKTVILIAEEIDRSLEK